MAQETGEPGAAPRRRRLAIRVAAFSRWLHIYASMFSLASILFFGVTGLTLNHPDWMFGGVERTVESEGRVPLKWIQVAATSARSAESPAEPGGPVEKLAIVEALRRDQGVRGALDEFRVDEHECLVAFKGPGYSGDAFIDRDTGRYKLTQTFHGPVAILNDLHKGRDSGPVWSVLIDVSAILMAVVSLSGFVLLFYLKVRRVQGLWIGLIGLIALVALYALFVP